MENVFKELANINVNEHCEKKNGLTYLSWAWAVDEIGKKYPDFNYKIKKAENGLPYFFEKGVGAMVFTEVTIDGITREMWLPVMDSSNKPMREEAYEYMQGGRKKTCEAIDMFAVNKTIMRCLVKNIAMFGLGLYIYAGEDLPTDLEPNKATTEQIAELRELQVNEFNLCKNYKVQKLDDLTEEQANEAIKIKRQNA